jgi:hypothetical protein
MADSTNPNVNEFSEQAANRIGRDKSVVETNKVISFSDYSTNTALPSYVIDAVSQNKPTIILPDDPAEHAQGNAMSDPTREEIREEVKDKIASAEARTDTKIERLGGKIEMLSATLGAKLDIVNQRLADHSKDRNLIIGTIVLSVISLAVLLIAVATYGDALFGRGISVRDVTQTVIKEQQEIQKRDTVLPPRH